MNIKHENNICIFNIPDEKGLQKFMGTKVTSEFEEGVKEKVTKELEPVERVINTLTEPASSTVVLGTALMSAIDMVKEPDKE